MKIILITGGCGFIGSNLIRYLINNTDYTIVNVDKLTYAGNTENLKDISGNSRYIFEKIDICNTKEITRIFQTYKPESIIHLAAESHVDRSIDGPGEFIQTNIIGTYNLLDISLKFYNELPENVKSGFRFLHVSTDEVFGSLGNDGFFTEQTPYDPSSPYSASKASSDHLVRAWCRTFKLPAIITNCSNNYGEYQFPEKLIPTVILNAYNNKPIPVYGKGANIRDWLYVQDHCKALLLVLQKGIIGETYNIGGRNEKTNLEVVQTICSIMDEIVTDKKKGSYKELITFVNDRPGHDLRYAIDPTKIETKLGWKQSMNFESGIKATVEWYLNNTEWWNNIISNKYKLQRLGVI